MSWEPTKKVLVLPDRMSDAITQNPNLWGYKHLTNSFFYPYDGNSYDTETVDPEIFEQNYIDDDAVRFARDPNHPKYLLDHVLNLETQNVWNTELDGYQDRTQQYINMANMIKTVGRQAAIYGVWTGPAEYNRWYNIGRYEYRLDPSLYPDYAANLQNSKAQMRQFRREERKVILGNLNRLRDRFSQFVDAIVLDLYQFYNIPSLNSEAWYSWRNMTRRKIACYKYVFGSDMPLYAFIQPVFTETFTAMPSDVWDAMVGEIYGNADIDRVYVFITSTATPAADWQDVLIDGPNYSPID